MNTVVAIVFGAVYLGMVAGGLPGLAIDRTGVALLGAIALVAAGMVTLSDVWEAVDLPTITLLFSLMVVSAQFRLAGFYTELVRRVVALELSAPGLLALVLGVAGGLSAILTNDVVCLAMTPVLLEGCARRGLNPLPFLLGLACASNVGSAATLIGNPQNILIGQSLGLSFGSFLFDAGVPSLLGLAATWVIIVWQQRGRWVLRQENLVIPAPRFDPWQSCKALGVTAALIVLFLFCQELPREGVALACAGVLLLSRRMASREMLSLVDWQVLVLFVGLFVVNHAFEATGMPGAALAASRTVGIDATRPEWLFGLGVVLSNLVSNVPATMLLLPAATGPDAGPVLALSSTLAGNLFIVGSIANIIVVTSARSFGIEIDYRTHAKAGVPVTLVTLAIAAGWLWLRSR